MLQKLQTGDRIPKELINTLVEDHNKKSSPEFTRAHDTLGEGTLWGQCASVVPVYSLFEIYDASVTVVREDVPVVGIRAPTSDAPLCLATNGTFPTIAGKPSPIELLMQSAYYKFDVDTADVGFVVGAECGPATGSHQVDSDGSGLICLTLPATYATTRKFIWAAVLSGSGRRIKLRVNGNDWQISYDGGTTWENWVTGGVCS